MVFTLASDTDPALLVHEELLSGQTYELYARVLFLKLFEQEQEQVLVPLLLAGYAPASFPSTSSTMTWTGPSIMHVVASGWKCSATRPFSTPSSSSASSSSLSLPS